MTLAQARTDKYQPNLTPLQWAYLAGIIDGEGTISILRVKKPGRKKLAGGQGPAHYILHPVLTIANTHEGLLTWLAQHIGTRINRRQRPQMIGTYHYNRLPQVCYQVQIWGYQVYHVIRQVEPYLIVKKEQATLVRMFIEHRLKQANTQYNAPYTEEQQQIWLQVRALNRHESRPYPVEASLTVKSTI